MLYIPTKEELQKYIDSGKSQYEIKDIFKVSQSAVSNWYKKYNLKSKVKTGGAFNVKDLTGKIFGNLTVLSYYNTDSHGKNYLCRCKCGNEKIYRGSTLTSGAVIGCGCYVGKSNIGLTHDEEAMSHIGEKYGKLIIIDISKTNHQYNMVCKCECGNIKTIKLYDLSCGKTVSCGCYQKEQASKTGSTIGLNNYKNGYHWYFIQNNERVSCRSGYEVIYANYLMQNNIKFKYEPKCFVLANKRRYTPDFYLTDTDEWIEIKGTFKVNNSRQKDNIKIFKQTHKHKILFWEDIVSECNLRYKTYNTFLNHADIENMSKEDYLAKQCYFKYG